MVLFNYSTKELTAKIVYYGPGLCGKTTNLQFIFDNLPSNIHKGKMLSLATKTDRTLFFDFLPIDLGTIRGMRTRLQLYTVPGQVFYNTTRKLVLKGADGLVFVADSQKKMLDANRESFANMETNLIEHGMELPKIPHVLQFNKRDLKEVLSVEELNASLNKHNVPIYEAVATTGIGVQDTLKAVTRLVLNSLREKYSDGKRPSVAKDITAVQQAPPLPPARARESSPLVEPAEPVLELAEDDEELPVVEIAEDESVQVLAVAEEEILEVSEEAGVSEEVPVLQVAEEDSPLTLEAGGSSGSVAATPLAASRPGAAAGRLDEESPFGEIEIEESAPGRDDVLDSGPFEEVRAGYSSEALEIEIPEAEEPSPIGGPGAGGATIAIDAGAASEPRRAPAPSAGGRGAASQETSIPLTIDVHGREVRLVVTVTVRVEKR